MADKRAFFELLDELDRCSDEAEDKETDFDRVLARSRKRNEPEINPFVASSHTLTSALNTKSPVPTTLLSGLQCSVQASAVSSRHGRSDSASSGDRVAPAVTRSHMDGPAPEKSKVSMTSATSKRKRAHLPKVIPENQQIFKGLNFCE